MYIHEFDTNTGDALLHSVRLWWFLCVSLQ